MEEDEIKKVRAMIDNSIRESTKFSSRKFGDTPTDELQLTPQKYVDLNGLISERPKSPKVGQRFFVTSLNYSIYSDGISSWFSGTGSIVAAL